jgi:hypothetical protein
MRFFTASFCKIADGICAAVTSAGEPWSGTNVFATFIAYDRFVVLRPAQLG